MEVFGVGLGLRGLGVDRTCIGFGSGIFVWVLGGLGEVCRVFCVGWRGLGWAGLAGLHAVCFKHGLVRGATNGGVSIRAP